MLCVFVYLDILGSMSHDSHSHTNPIIVLLFYNSCNRLSQATWHIVYCISHTKPDSFSTLFQAFDSFVCNNRCLLILPHASLIPHYRRQFFFSTAQIRQMLAQFWFSGPPFSVSAHSRLFYTLPPLLRSAVSARSRDRRIKEGHLI